MPTGAAPAEDPQSGLFDREVDDVELEIHLQTMLANKMAARAFNASKKKVKERMERHELREGERVRVGKYIVTGVRRDGGGFEIPEWEKVGIAGIEES